MKHTFKTDRLIPAGTPVTISFGEPKKPERDYIFSFEGQLTDGEIRDYESKVAAFKDRRVLGKGVRQKFDGGLIAVRHDQLAPTIDPDTRVMDCSQLPQEPDHSEWATFHEKLDSGYLVHGKTYEIEYWLKPVNHEWWIANWPHWCLAMQGWGPVYPGGKNASPPFFLRVYGGKWQCGVRPGVPHTPTWREIKGEAQFEAGLAKWKVTYKPDRESGYVRFELNGEKVLEHHGPTCLTNKESAGDRGPLIRFGSYAAKRREPGQKKVGFKVHRFSIAEA